MKLLILSIILLLFTLNVTSRSHHRFTHLDSPTKPTLTKLSSNVISTNHGGLIEFNSFLESMQPYNLTQGETRSIFRLCDRDRDDRISVEEWENCINVFILPYENTCLTSKDYMLYAKDLKKCLTLPVFGIVPTKVIEGESTTEQLLLDILNRDEEKRINFADFIFLRRVSFAWKECSVDGRINKRRMECALSATTPQKRKFLPISNQVFNIAVQLYKTKVKENEAFLDFFSFAKIAYIYYYFNEFELPFQEEYLTKKALIQGIEDQILPTSVTVEFVNQIYFTLDPKNNGFKAKLDFAGYASVNHLYRIYKKYGNKDKNGVVSFKVKGFEKMVKEGEWDNFDTVLLGAVELMDEKEYTSFVEAKYQINNAGINDRDYFTRFSQVVDKSNKYETIFNVFGNFSILNLFIYFFYLFSNVFSLNFGLFLDTKMQEKWNFTTLVLFSKLTWAFQAIDSHNEG